MEVGNWLCLKEGCGHKDVYCTMLMGAGVLLALSAVYFSLLSETSVKMTLSMLLDSLQLERSVDHIHGLFHPTLYKIMYKYII
jgi:hypothetical protein